MDTSNFTEYELVINNSNELFAVKSTDDTGNTKLIKINQTNGDETELINFQQNFIQSLTFNNSTNEIYGVGSSPLNLNILYKINILNNTFTTVELEIADNAGYELFYGNSKLYAIKETESATIVTSELIEINPENGNQTSIINFNEYVGELAFDFSENMMFGIGSNNELFKINLTNNNFTTINLDNSQNIDYELIFLQ